jgi:hypothetical protein
VDRRSIPERHKYLKCEAASVQKNPKGFALGGSLSAATWLSSARRLVFGGLGGQAVGTKLNRHHRAYRREKKPARLT